MHFFSSHCPFQFLGFCLFWFYFSFETLLTSLFVWYSNHSRAFPGDPNVSLGLYQINFQKGEAGTSKEAEMRFVKWYLFRSMVRQQHQREKRLPRPFILADFTNLGKVKMSLWALVSSFVDVFPHHKIEMGFNSIEWKGRNNRHHKPQLKRVGCSVWESCETSALALSKILLLGFQSVWT